MWVTSREFFFWNPTLYAEEMVQVVVLQCLLCVKYEDATFTNPVSKKILFYLLLAPCIALKRSTETLNTWV